ncbi:MAG: hypothetical protein JWO52_8049 [Gammaproteobacteria bacterium]|jgi:hypothetical protein|nr:hypothetical protein [Gammaproteobacteria bacterium]
MPKEIEIASLTTCQVCPDGRHVRLNFANTRAGMATLRVTSACVQQLLMTLPRLLSTALKIQHRDSSVRAVFPLHDWRLEAAVGSGDLILTMTTTDGFEVAFSLSATVIAQISSAAQQRSSTAEQRQNSLDS